MRTMQQLRWISNILFLGEILQILSLVHFVSCARSGTLTPTYLDSPPTPKTAAEIEAAFTEHELVPDIVDKAPNHSLQVTLCTDNYVNFGNFLIPHLWEKLPVKISFDSVDDDRMYVLIMTEPDHPKRGKSKGYEWYHWVIGDIPGRNFRKGKTVMVYVGPTMKEKSGLHRIAFLLLEQLDGKIIFEEKHLSPTTNERKRARHNTRKFMAKYNLTGPVAGNFFISGYNY